MEPCRNCGIEFCGNFCPDCGQEALLGAPTTLGFIYEFITRNMLERGKLPKTLWQLIRYPGSLTVDFLEGRRQRSIRPVRLYVGLSIFYFLLLSITSNVGAEFAKNFGGNDAMSIQPKPHVMAPEFDVESKDLVFLDYIFSPATSAKLKKRIGRFASLPEKEAAQTIANGIMHQIPKAMFFLVPVFAVILKALFYSTRIPYGAHLLFAFHYHALLFVCLLTLLLPIPELIETIVFMSALLYLPLAMRTTYAIGWWATLWRCFVLSSLYIIAIWLALFGALTATLLL